MLLPLMGVEAQNVQILPDLEYDVLKDYVVRLGNVDYGSVGRVKDVAAQRPSALRPDRPERSSRNEAVRPDSPGALQRAPGLRGRRNVFGRDAGAA